MLEQTRSHLAVWQRRLAGTLPVRCLGRFLRIDGRNRSLVIAGQAFTTLIPLLIITAGLTGGGAGGDIGESLVERFRLTDDSAEAMRTLFARPPTATGALSLAGIVVLLASLLSLTRALQRTYEAAWDLPTPGGLTGVVSGLSGMSLLATQVIVLGLLASVLSGSPGAPVTTPVVRLIALVPAWWLLQYLLLSRRVSARRLFPGAVVAAAGQVGVSLVSAVWMPRIVAGNAERYGLIGVTFAMISWLIILAFAIVISAVISKEIAPPDRIGDAPPEPAPEISLRKDTGTPHPSRAIPAGPAAPSVPTGKASNVSTASEGAGDGGSSGARVPRQGDR